MRACVEERAIVERILSHANSNLSVLGTVSARKPEVVWEQYVNAMGRVRARACNRVWRLTFGCDHHASQTPMTRRRCR